MARLLVPKECGILPKFIPPFCGTNLVSFLYPCNTSLHLENSKRDFRTLLKRIDLVQLYFRGLTLILCPFIGAVYNDWILAFILTNRVSFPLTSLKPYADTTGFWDQDAAHKLVRRTCHHGTTSCMDSPLRYFDLTQELHFMILEYAQSICLEDVQWQSPMDTMPLVKVGNQTNAKCFATHGRSIAVLVELSLYISSLTRSALPTHTLAAMHRTRSTVRISLP